MGFVTKYLAKGKSTSKVQAFPLSQKVSPIGEDLPIDYFELERAYRKDSICFSSLNKATQMIMSAGYEIISKDDVKTFLTNIGLIGEDITFDELLESLFKYQMIYGNAYLELVYDKRTDSKIVDITLMDPKRIDYLKTTDKRVITDKVGKPVGYVLSFPYGYNVKDKGDDIPSELRMSVESHQIFMLPKRVCHFKLYTTGDRFYGTGLIEPAYKSIIRKMNIEEAQTNSIYARGTYPVVAYVGDETHEATPQDIKSVLDNLVKLKHDRYMAFQHWIKVEPMEIKQSDIVQDTLIYLRRNQIASHGMPEAFAVGSGEATNRATLTNQQKILEYTLNDIVNRTLSTLQKYLFRRLEEYNKFSPAKIKWGDIGAEEINDKVTRLNKYIQSGVLTPEEVKKFATKSEGLNEK